MAEYIGPINNRVLLNLLDQNLKSGSISAKEYRDLKKQFFGKPKLIQMELFPKDPKKKRKGGLMEQANGLKKMGLKKGGLTAATAKLKAQGLKKGGFPDLSGDGKVTMKDILMGRGVIKKPKKKQKGGAVSVFEKARQAKPSGRLTVDDIKRATPKPSMTLKGGKLKGVKDAPEERRKEKLKRAPKAIATGLLGAAKGVSKLAGRLAKRGYGLARK